MSDLEALETALDEAREDMEVVCGCGEQLTTDTDRYFEQCEECRIDEHEHNKIDDDPYYYEPDPDNIFDR